jgi:hypothetical protein
MEVRCGGVKINEGHSTGRNGGDFERRDHPFQGNPQIKARACGRPPRP